MSIDVFKVGSTYHYRFQVKPFPRQQRSTRLRNRRLALEVAERAYVDAITRANGGEPVPTLAALLADWLAVRGAHSSAHHVRSVKTFAKLHMHGLSDVRIDQLGTDAVERARGKHLADHNHASTNHWLRILKLLVSWAVRRKILPRLPWDVTMLPVQKRPRAILPMSAVTMWFAAVDAATGRAPYVSTAVRLMLLLGLRESEVITARWEWFDWERGTYTPGETKGNEADALPLFDWLIAELAPLKRIEGLVVCMPDGAPVAPGFSRRAIRAANAACSVKGITPHRLRGTIATVLSEAGTPVQSVQAYLRHKDIRTTMVYLEKNMDHLTKAQAKIAQKAGLTWRKSGEDLQSEP